MRRLVLLASALVLALTIASAAAANMAKWWADGERRGAIVPRNDTEVGVDSEELVFDVAPSLASAKVTATYRMTHAGASATEADVAFVVVEGEHAYGHETEAEITIDGVRAAYRVVTSAEAVAPMLDAWLTAHADAEAELARMTAPDLSPRYEDWERLSRVVPGCHGECSGLVRWYRMKKRPASYDTDAMRRDAALEAAKSAIPDELQKLYDGWSTRAVARPLSWLLFKIPFAARQTRTVVVHYEHQAGYDKHRGVRNTYIYDYVLSPAKRWARFAALHVAIHVPPQTRVHGSLPLSRTRADEANGETYGADLDTLPNGELSFDLMSIAGLPFGMTHPWAYWCALLAVMFAVTFGLGRRLGRRLRRASTRARRVAGSFLVVGALGFAVHLALVMLAAKLVPPYAFGGGYDALIGFTAAIFFFTGTGIAISLVTATNAPRPEVG